MSCSAERVATAVDFVGFWCTATVLTGYHTAVSGTTLTDTNATFLASNAKQGQYIRNITQNIEAKIASISSDTQLTTLPAITWATNDTYELIEATYQQVIMLNGVLNKAMSPISVSLLTAGMCDCSVDPVSLTYLQTLNIISAAILPACMNCGLMRPNWGDAEKKNWMDWLNNELKLIRDGEVELCQGEVGKNFPVLEWAEINYGRFSQAEIYFNSIRRSLF